MVTPSVAQDNLVSQTRLRIAYPRISEEALLDSPKAGVHTQEALHGARLKFENCLWNSKGQCQLCALVNMR